MKKIQNHACLGQVNGFAPAYVVSLLRLVVKGAAKLSTCKRRV